MNQQPQPAHWNNVARQWHKWRPPLSPCPADIRLMEDWVRQAPGALNAQRSQALLWGVTPEIANMAWPQGMELLAVDKSQEMIDVVWPGDIPGRRRAVQGNWLDFPDEQGAYAAIVADGSPCLFHYPDEYRLLANRADRLLAKPGGILIVRLFAQAEQRETLEEVLAALRARRISSIHVLKFRLGMALQPSVQAGVRMVDIYRAWTQVITEFPGLVSSLGWSVESLETIEPYRNSNTHLSFPTIREFDAVLGEAFERVDCRFPDYEMGDRCPTVYYRKRG